MKLGRELWLAMNARQSYTSEVDASPVLSKLSWVGDQLHGWYQRTTKEERRSSKFLTSETYEDALLICEGVPAFAKYVFTILSPIVPGGKFKPKVLSQDPLEKTFGVLRQNGGGTQHITVKTIAYNLRTVNCNVLNSKCTKS